MEEASLESRSGIDYEHSVDHILNGIGTANVDKLKQFSVFAANYALRFSPADADAVVGAAYSLDFLSKKLEIKEFIQRLIKSIELAQFHAKADPQRITLVDNKAPGGTADDYWGGGALMKINKTNSSAELVMQNEIRKSDSPVNVAGAVLLGLISCLPYRPMRPPAAPLS